MYICVYACQGAQAWNILPNKIRTAANRMEFNIIVLMNGMVRKAIVMYVPCPYGC